MRIRYRPAGETSDRRYCNNCRYLSKCAGQRERRSFFHQQRWGNNETGGITKISAHGRIACDGELRKELCDTHPTDPCARSKYVITYEGKHCPCGNIEGAARSTVVDIKTSRLRASGGRLDGDIATVIDRRA